ncbi:MAG: FMN-binding protein [Patescibacteria group bacterium]|nr:FMN-binding protein [Patescibacteria group bacterium]
MDSDASQLGYLRQAWLVILLGLLYGGALAGVQTSLGPRIEQNRRAETFRVIPQIVPGADAAHTEELTVTGADGQPARVFRACDAQGKQVGWVLPTGGLGFADRIDLLVGLDVDRILVTGMYVLDQKETPGLGNFIEDEPFRGQFVGKSAEAPLVVIKVEPTMGRNEIQTLSGATISSESVANIINAAIVNLRDALRTQATESRR